MDGDNLENAPRLDADLFYMDKIDAFFKTIRIRVDGALVTAIKNKLID